MSITLDPDLKPRGKILNFPASDTAARGAISWRSSKIATAVAPS